MKKYLPFVFPAAAMLVVVFLTYRWYSHNTTGVGQITEFAEGIEIEQLTDDEQSIVGRGAADVSTVTLESVGRDSDVEGDEELAQISDTATGQVRYEIQDERVRFSVIATLPETEMGFYQVWLKAIDSDAVRRAFILEMTKAGFQGSAAISADTLPFEVIVSLEKLETDSPSNTLLRGVVQTESAAEQE